MLDSEGGPPLVGIYVGETGAEGSTPNRLYIGLVSKHGGESKLGNLATSRLIAVQSASVSQLAVGPPEPLDDALARGPRLLAELQNRHRTPPR